MDRLRPAADAVIITGDLTECDLVSEYAEPRAMLARELHVAVYVIPGNHDRREVLLRELPGVREADGFVQYAVEDFPLWLLMLDTVVPGAGHGELCPIRLAWLDRTLGKAPDTPTLIGMHHPPFQCGIGHMDRIALRDPAAFLAVVSRPSPSRAHRQRPSPSPRDRPLRPGYRQHLPSVAHQVELDLSEDAPSVFTLEPPGYQIHRRRPDTGVVMHTALVDSYPGPFPFLEDPDYPAPRYRAGSSRSRNQSPSTLTQNVVSTTTALGASRIQGARVRYSRP